MVPETEGSNDPQDVNVAAAMRDANPQTIAAAMKDDPDKAGDVAAAVVGAAPDKAGDIADAAVRAAPDKAGDIAAAAVRAAPNEQGAVAAAMQAASPQTVAAALQEASPENREAVLNALMPTPGMADHIWLIIVSAFAVVFVLSALTLFWTALSAADGAQMLLTVVTTVAGILAGFISGRSATATAARPPR